MRLNHLAGPTTRGHARLIGAALAPPVRSRQRYFTARVGMVNFYRGAK